MILFYSKAYNMSSEAQEDSRGVAYVKEQGVCLSVEIMLTTEPIQSSGLVCFSLSLEMVLVYLLSPSITEMIGTQPLVSKKRLNDNEV